MYQIINRIGIALLFLALLVAESENLVIPAAVVTIAVVMILAGKGVENNDE